MLGRYRPLRPLGSGGSGSVWLARDEQTGLDIALKIVPREGKAAARAEREAQAAAQLRHRSCLRAYAFARDPRHVYIAYEFVPGRTVREALRAGDLDDAAAIEACAQICDGLAHAHRAGILHRDVKPSNVLLADGDRISVRILDFGLARMAEAETLTAQGDVPGTLAYIAPERLAGEDATGAADVWAVGVMLWEALSGHHPFWQTSMIETARAIEAGAPSLSTLRPDLPNALLQLVDRSLSLAPGRRPTAQELADSSGARPRRAASSAPGPAGSPFPTRWPGAAQPFSRRASPAGRRAHCRSSRTAGRSGSPWPPRRSRRSASASASRSRSPCPSCRSGTSPSASRSSTARLRPPGSRSRGASRARACSSRPAPCSRRSPRSGSCRFSSPVSGRCPRRAAQGAVAVLAAALAAGLQGVPLPLTGEPAPLGIGVAGASDPLDVVGSLARVAAAHPALLAEAAAFAVLAAALPLVRPYGRWGAAGFGAAMLLLSVPVAPAGATVPLVAAAWATAAVLGVRADDPGSLILVSSG